MNNESKFNNTSVQKSEEEIDLKKIINIFLRNKNLIASFTLLLFVVSGIYSSYKKKIWEGEFQIVVKQSMSKALRLNFTSTFDVSFTVCSKLKTGM